MTSPPQPPVARRRRTRALTLLGTAVLLGAVPSAAHAGPQHAASPSTPTTSSATAGDTLEYFDSRSAGTATQKALGARAATMAAKPSKGVRDLRHQLGTEGILDMDPLTATPR
jgi:extracellular elastinolytic metalloproteinase